MFKNKWKYTIQVILVCALLYLVFDAPIRATGFLKFHSFIGMKCLLPLLCGLLFGYVGAIGCAIGSLAANVMFAVPVGDLVYECILCLVGGTLFWLLWHMLDKSGRVNIKTPKKLALYVCTVFVSAAVCGAIGLLFGDSSYFTSVLVAYTTLGIIVGIPVLIIAVSIVCIDTIVPPFRTITNDIEYELTKLNDLSTINEKIEVVAFAKKIPMKRIIEIENCIEESAIRIMENAPGTKIKLSLYLSDSLSLKLLYDGVRFNPMKKQEREDEFSLISLALIRSRALRVGYGYKKGTNHLHVVV